MSLLLLIRGNLRRDRLRTLLTVLSIGSAVLLLAALLAVRDALRGALESPGARQLLGLRDRYAPDTGDLPRSYGDRLAGIEGVDGVLPWSYVFVRVNSTSSTMGIATDAHALPRLVPPLVHGIPPEQYEQFRGDAHAVLMGRELVQRFKWSVGDTVTLVGGSVSGDFPVRIAGVLDFPMLADNFLMHDAYYQALRAPGGVANIFFFHVADPARVDEVRRAVEASFAGEPVRLEVLTIAQYVAAAVSRAGEVSGFVVGLAAVVGIATLLVVGNTLAMAARERAHDTAVLRSLGFTSLQVGGVVLGEASCVALAGSLLGGLGAYGAFHAAGFSLPVGAQSYFRVGATTVLESLAIGLGLGLLAGLPSALRSARVDVITVLRGVS